MLYSEGQQMSVENDGRKEEKEMDERGRRGGFVELQIRTRRISRFSRAFVSTVNDRYLINRRVWPRSSTAVTLAMWVTCR
jgi:hypothetical protein